MSYGFLNEPIKIGEDYVFGGLSLIPQTIIQPDGDWASFLPLDEFQNLHGIDPQACTTFGTINCVEILIKQLGGNKNYSDRWLAWESGTSVSGNTPQRVAETLRKTGVPFQFKWDFDKEVNTIKKFYENPPTGLFKDAREDFTYDFKHEYVPVSEFSLRNALRMSPLGVSVSAWFKEGEFYIKPEGMRDNHWCVCYGFDNDKKAWKIFDSYDNSKKLYKGQFEVAKRYWIGLSTPKLSFWGKIWYTLFK